MANFFSRSFPILPVRDSEGRRDIADHVRPVVVCWYWTRCLPFSVRHTEKYSTKKIYACNFDLMDFPRIFGWYIFKTITWKFFRRLDMSRQMSLLLAWSFFILFWRWIKCSFSRTPDIFSSVSMVKASLVNWSCEDVLSWKLSSSRRTIAFSGFVSSTSRIDTTSLVVERCPCKEVNKKKKKKK